MVKVQNKSAQSSGFVLEFKGMPELIFCHSCTLWGGGGGNPVAAGKSVSFMVSLSSHRAGIFQVQHTQDTCECSRPTLHGDVCSRHCRERLEC